MKGLDGAALADAAVGAASDGGMRERAAALATALRSEDGLGGAVRALEGLRD